jgi:hypothetical protein
MILCFFNRLLAQIRLSGYTERAFLDEFGGVMSKGNIITALVDMQHEMPFGLLQ